jgi:hypothetical protein
MAVAIVVPAEPSTTAAAAPRHRCQFNGYHQVRANDRAVLLRTSDGQSIIGCTYASGRRVVLTTFDSPPPGAPSVLAGIYAATVVQSCSKYADNDCDELVVVFNLVTRREVPNAIDSISVTDLVLRSNGSVAAIGSHTPGDYVVDASDRTGGHHLDPGPNVSPGSLALVGPHLYWLRDGLPQTAVLG